MSREIININLDFGFHWQGILCCVRLYGSRSLLINACTRLAEFVFKFLSSFTFLFYLFMYLSALSFCMCAGQKRASDPSVVGAGN